MTEREHPPAGATDPRARQGEEDEAPEPVGDAEGVDAATSDAEAAGTATRDAGTEDAESTPNPQAEAAESEESPPEPDQDAGATAAVSDAEATPETDQETSAQAVAPAEEEPGPDAEDGTPGDEIGAPEAGEPVSVTGRTSHEDGSAGGTERVATDEAGTAPSEDDVDGESGTPQVGEPAAPASSPAPGAPAGAPATNPRQAWSRLLRMARPRATKANVLALALALLLGFAIVTQVRQTHRQGLENLREDELVRVLDDVTTNGSRLASELRDLERTRDALLSGAGASEQAQKAAQERLDTLGILAGTVPVEGPGITITIEDPGSQITASDLLDALEELRDAGAEAVQIGDVRVVASTYFTDTDAGVEISGHVLSRPYQIVAIGDPATMASAMDIPGGVTERVRQRGGTAVVDQKESLRITALHTVAQPRYAQPVPESSATSGQ